MTKEEREYHRWLTQTMNKYRGEFIDIAIYMERSIVQILNLYFIGADWLKIRHFNELISQDLTFEMKTRLFQKLIKGNILPEELEIQPEIIHEIDEFKKLRNKFAHVQIDGRVEKIAERTNVRDRLNLLTFKGYDFHEEELIVNDLAFQLVDFNKLSIKLIKISNKYHEIINIQFPDNHSNNE